MNRLRNFVSKRYLLIVGLVILALACGAYFFGPKAYQLWQKRGEVQGKKAVSVDTPSIVNGELVLPKVYTGSVVDAGAKIQVLSAFLVGVFEEQQQQQANPFAPPPEPPKLIGIRILGEVTNLSKGIIKEISPVVRFYDDKDKLIAQKVGKITPGFDFFSFKPAEKTVYDILIEDPPKADKLEILVNSKTTEKTLSFETLKVVSSEMEVKKAKYNPSGEEEKGPEKEGSESAEATPAAKVTPDVTPEVTEVEYYTLSGKFQNNLTSDVSDVSVYAWLKNAEGKVFSFARQDFKGDLISPKKQVDFKINLLPFKIDEKMESYEVRVYGKRYQL